MLRGCLTGMLVSFGLLLSTGVQAETVSDVEAVLQDAGYSTGYTGAVRGIYALEVIARTCAASGHLSSDTRAAVSRLADAADTNANAPELFARLREATQIEWGATMDSIGATTNMSAFCGDAARTIGEALSNGVPQASDRTPDELLQAELVRRYGAGTASALNELYFAYVAIEECANQGKADAALLQPLADAAKRAEANVDDGELLEELWAIKSLGINEAIGDAIKEDHLAVTCEIIVKMATTTLLNHRPASKKPF